MSQCKSLYQCKQFDLCWSSWLFICCSSAGKQLLQMMEELGLLILGCMWLRTNIYVADFTDEVQIFFYLLLVCTHTNFLICFWGARDTFLIYISLWGMFLALHTKSVFSRHTSWVSKIYQKCNLTATFLTYQIHSFNEYLFCRKNILKMYLMFLSAQTYLKCILISWRANG